MKTTISLQDREKKWRRYHQFERQYKKAWLSKISEKESYKIFSGLYQFYLQIATKPVFGKLEMEKVKTLAAIHSIYGRVKT